MPSVNQCGKKLCRLEEGAGFESALALGVWPRVVSALFQEAAQTCAG